MLPASQQIVISVGENVLAHGGAGRFLTLLDCMDRGLVGDDISMQTKVM